jgi:hypothetical protein
MIKVASAWGSVGGSTIAFNNLVNLFNSKGYKACLYTPGTKKESKDKWSGITCAWDHLENLRLGADDIFIYHFMGITQRPPARRVILSCHETNVFPLKKIPDLVYDDLQFVSNFQREWQEVDGWVIPNVITSYTKNNIRKNNKVAGILGSIDAHKSVHESIKRALNDDDVSRVVIYGLINDMNYFNESVLPLLGPRVSYCGIATDMQKVYDEVDVVYSSSKRECLPMIQGECMKMGMEYRGLDQNTRAVEDYDLDDNAIFEKWKKLIS